MTKYLSPWICIKDVPIKKKIQGTNLEICAIIKRWRGEIGDAQIGTYLLYLKLKVLTMCKCDRLVTIVSLVVVPKIWSSFETSAMKQSNLDQYSFLSLRSILARDILARLKYIISVDRGSILYAYSLFSILRERLLTYPRSTIPLLFSILLFPGCNSGCTIHVTDVDGKWHRCTSAVREVQTNSKTEQCHPRCLWSTFDNLLPNSYN